jgi:hypothetical protein
LLRAGNPHPLDEQPQPSSQYAPGGILRHPMCTGRDCAPNEPTIHADDYGFLYGANVIDVWTEPTDTGAVLYWNVSTWHPYQVLLLRSVAVRADPPGAAPDDDPRMEIDEEFVGDSPAAGSFAPVGGPREQDSALPDEGSGAVRAPRADDVPVHPRHASDSGCRVTASGHGTWCVIAGALLVLRARGRRRARYCS